MAAGFCILYILSAVAAGFSSETLCNAMLPLMCLVFWVVQANTGHGQKEKIAAGIGWLSTVISFISILALCGVYVLNGNSTAGRLQFTFQYANAAGIYFAAIALFVRGINNKKLEKFIPALETALFLTQSVGAAAAYIIGLIIVGFTKGKNERVKYISETAGKIFCSIGFAVLIFASISILNISILSVIITCLLMLFCWYSEKVFGLFVKFRINYILLALLIGGIVFILFTQRVQQASQTLIERLIQINDGISAIREKPLVGVGPGNWQYIQGIYKSAQYNAQIIHSSLIQIAADAGLPALLVLISLIIYKLKRIKTNIYLRASAIIILIHAVLDFTLAFASIDIILIFILNYDAEYADIKDKANIFKRLVWIPVFLAFTFCFAGKIILAQAGRVALQENYEESVNILKSNKAFFFNSYEYNLNYAIYLQHSGDYDGALKVVESLKDSSLQSVILESEILEQQKLYPKAADVIMKWLERAPYDYMLYDRAKNLISELSGDEKATFVLRFNECAQRANNSYTFLSGMLKNQNKIQLYNQKGELE